jgi:hypothetical protein
VQERTGELPGRVCEEILLRGMKFDADILSKVPMST